MIRETFLSEAELFMWLADEDWYPSAHTADWLKRTPRPDAAPVLARLAQKADLEPMNPLSILIMVGVTAGFVPSQGATGKKVMERKAGIRAALYLADFDEPLAIAPLCRLWTSSAVKKSKYHDQIEAALTRLLSQKAGDIRGETVKAVQNLAGRVWRAEKPKRDLTNRQADLLIAALSFLRDSKESGVPSAPVSSLPNRARVQEAAC